MKVECDDCGSCSDCFKITTRGKMKALLIKNVLRMWRNIGVMFFIFVLPVMQVILFCLAIGRDPTGLKLAIVNHEANFTNATYQHCPIAKGCSFTSLSCRYLRDLNNETIVQEYYPDTESAIEAVRLGNAWGALYFTENFTDALVARMVLGRDADEETLDQSEIRVWLDMSSKFTRPIPFARASLIFFLFRSTNRFNVKPRFTVWLQRLCSEPFRNLRSKSKIS